MLKLLNVYIRLGESLSNVDVAPILAEESANLAEHFREPFRKSPDHFNSTTELEGFAPVHFEFTALCQTVGLVVVAPFTPGRMKPDAVCLLVNGLETKEDIAAVKAKVTLPPLVWMELEKSEKPVAVNVFFVNGRLRDPATITILSALANVYFSLFGTSQVEQVEAND